MKSAAEVLADYDALYKVPNEERWIIDGDEAQLAADLAAVVRDLQAQVSAAGVNFDGLTNHDEQEQQ